MLGYDVHTFCSYLRNTLNMMHWLATDNFQTAKVQSTQFSYNEKYCYDALVKSALYCTVEVERGHFNQSRIQYLEDPVIKFNLLFRHRDIK